MIRNENTIVVHNKSFLLTGNEKYRSQLLLRCTKENKNIGKTNVIKIDNIKLQRNEN